MWYMFFFFNDTATPEIYTYGHTRSLHYALPIFGYGATHRATGPARIATVAAGYADGYLRSLSSHGHAWVAGHRVPVVGRVSMDLLALDVTAIAPDAARPGDWAELISAEYDVDAVAREAGTIGYEILTSLGAPYHRVYLRSEERRVGKAGVSTCRY